MSINDDDFQGHFRRESTDGNTLLEEGFSISGSGPERIIIIVVVWRCQHWGNSPILSQ